MAEDDCDNMIRQDLVKMAVSFLTRPSVIPASMESKITFLKTKQLTDAEIKFAFDGTKDYFKQVLDASTQSDNNQLQAYKKPVPPVLPPHERKEILWPLIKFNTSLFLFGFMLHGLHYFYKNYVHKLIFGIETEIDAIQETVKKINRSLMEITKLVMKINHTLLKQNVELKRLLQVESRRRVLLEECKQDLCSLKSLLIGRHNFPQIPIHKEIFH